MTEVVWVAYIASEELNIFVVVPLHKVEHGYRLLATSEKVLDNMTAEETTSTNDQVRVFGCHRYLSKRFGVVQGEQRQRGSILSTCLKCEHQVLVFLLIRQEVRPPSQVPRP